MSNTKALSLKYHFVRFSKPLRILLLLIIFTEIKVVSKDEELGEDKI